jgi:hypothetical protein
MTNRRSRLARSTRSGLESDSWSAVPANHVAGTDKRVHMRPITANRVAPSGTVKYASADASDASRDVAELVMGASFGEIVLTQTSILGQV